MSQTMTNPTAKSPSAIFDYGKWRNEFLRAILIGASVLGFIALAANFIAGACTSDLITFLAAFVILLLTTLIPFPYWLKAMVVLVLVYALGIQRLFRYGTWGRFTHFHACFSHYGLPSIFTAGRYYFHNHWNTDHNWIRMADL